MRCFNTQGRTFLFPLNSFSIKGVCARLLLRGSIPACIGYAYAKER